MIINNLTLAHLCNDLQNAQDYKIDGNNCYYKDEFIGEIKEEWKNSTYKIEENFSEKQVENFIKINSN